MTDKNKQKANIFFRVQRELTSRITIDDLKDSTAFAEIDVPDDIFTDYSIEILQGQNDIVILNEKWDSFALHFNIKFKDACDAILKLTFYNKVTKENEVKILTIKAFKNAVELPDPYV